MPTLNDLSQLNQAVAARRVRDPAQLYQHQHHDPSPDQDRGWLSREVPLAVAEALLAYAKTWDLELTATASDLFPLKHDGRYLTVLRWSGIERILRQTGLWMPGRSHALEVDGELMIEGSCWLRYAQGYQQWCEVSAVAAFSAFAERDFASDDLTDAAVTGDWQLIPELKLAEAAQYLAAAKALGEVVTAHECIYKHPAILVHHGLISERQRC